MLLFVVGWFVWCCCLLLRLSSVVVRCRCRILLIVDVVCCLFALGVVFVCLLFFFLVDY